MRNVVKVRLYPDAEQQIALAKAFGCTRFGITACFKQIVSSLKRQEKEFYKATMKELEL